MNDNDNMNAEIARLIGWTHDDADKCGLDLPFDPKFDTDRGAALGLIEHTAALDKIGSIQISKSQNDWCCVVTYRRPPYIVDALADTLPLAIALACRNALVALSRVDGGDGQTGETP